MKIAKFDYSGNSHWGFIEGEELYALDGDLYGVNSMGDRICSLGEASLVAPISATNKVPAIAANYGEKDDRDGPGIFMKQPGTFRTFNIRAKFCCQGRTKTRHLG